MRSEGVMDNGKGACPSIYTRVSGMSMRNPAQHMSKNIAGRPAGKRN